MNLMKFWKDQTNSHNIYELDYELLTNNQETEIKSLINFLDLNVLDKFIEDIKIAGSKFHAEVKVLCYHNHALEFQKVQNELILDLMSSAYSHFPLTIEPKNVVGLGLNQTELEYNSMLGEFYVQNLNHNPVLPFVDQTFSVVVITVSIQYLIQPTLVFQQINRILKHNGLLVIFYSNRMFPTKAVAVWHQTNQDQKQDLIDKYFQVAENELGRFMPAQFLDITPSTQVDTYTDPVYVAMAKKIVR